jgi:hypothetical protein
VILITGDVNELTGHVIKIAVTVGNLPEDATGGTGYENSFAGAERIFAVYVRRIAGHDQLLTYSGNFLTDHA